MFNCCTISVLLFHHDCFAVPLFYYQMFYCCTIMFHCSIIRYSSAAPSLLYGSIISVTLLHYQMFYCSTIRCSIVPPSALHCSTISWSTVPPSEVLLFHHLFFTGPPWLFHCSTTRCSTVPPSLFHCSFDIPDISSERNREFLFDENLFFCELCTAFDTLKQCQWIIRTLSCKRKIWGRNSLYSRRYLKAFPIFDVFETCGVY